MKKGPACFILAILLVVSSCGGKQPGKVIRFWQFWDAALVESLVVDFEKSHPGIRVEIEQLMWKSGLEKIQAAIASGRQPDLCELGSTWVPRFSYEGVLADLTDVYAELADSFLAWDSARWRGRVYGIPWVQGSRALFYNRELFRRAGLDPESPPGTWSELLEAARAIDALGDDIYGFGLNLGERYVLYKKFMAFAWGNGARIIDPSGSKSLFAGDRMVEALEFYLDLARHSLREKQEVLDHSFKKGKLGMQISGAWNIRNLALEAPQLDYGVALVPKPDGPEGRHASFAGAEMLVVFAASKVKGESIELARYLASYPRAKRLSLAVGSVFPAAVEVQRDSTFAADPRLRVFIEQAAGSRTAPAHPGWLEMEDIVNQAVEAALYGRMDPRTAVTRADRKIQAVLDRYSAGKR